MMGRRQDKAFLLGVEELDLASTASVDAAGAESSERRSVFASAPEPAAEQDPASLISARASSRLLAALGLAAAALALLGAIVLGGGRQAASKKRTVEPRQPTAVIQPPPAPRQGHRSTRVDRHLRLRSHNFGQPHNRQTGRPRRPQSEPAPLAPPIDEPAPTPLRAAELVYPPPAPSPPPASGGGSGGRPEFSFER